MIKACLDGMHRQLQVHISRESGTHYFCNGRGPSTTFQFLSTPLISLASINLLKGLEIRIPLVCHQNKKITRIN